MGGLEESQTVGSPVSGASAPPEIGWAGTGSKVRDPDLGVVALLLRRLQLGDQRVGLVGPGDRLRQPGLSGGELRDLGQEVLALGATLLTRLDVVGHLAQMGLERLGAERPT